MDNKDFDELFVHDKTHSIVLKAIILYLKQREAALLTEVASADFASVDWTAKTAHTLGRVKTLRDLRLNILKGDHLDN